MHSAYKGTDAVKGISKLELDRKMDQIIKIQDST